MTARHDSSTESNGEQIFDKWGVPGLNPLMDQRVVNREHKAGKERQDELQ